MSCPNCGLETLPEQKFCRSCGASLQVITQPLAEEGARPLIEKSSLIIPKEVSRRNGLVLWGFIIMFLGTALGVIGKMLIHVDVVTVVGVLVALIGMFLTAYPYVSPSRPSTNDSSSKRELPTQPQPKSLHESTVDYVPSITERTTDLLKTPAAKRKRQ